MKAGFSSADISPSIGMEKPGSLSKKFHTSFHDPCLATALVVEGDSETVALVGLDTLSIKRSVIQVARQRIETETGISPDAVMVGASHTHAGGPIFGFRPGEFNDPRVFDPEFCEDLAQNHAVAPDPGYLEHVAGQIATAVIDAWQSRQEALLAVGSGVEGTVAFNRGFVMADGTRVTHPGKGNPDIVKPFGPDDPEVGVLSAWTPDDGFLGCVVNFTCHGTTGNPGISADWIYWMRRAISGGMHGGQVVFLNGACGDVTQVDNTSMQERESGPKWSRRVGQKVGAEALKILTMAESSEFLPISAESRLLHFEPREVSQERFQEALDVWESAPEDDWHRWFARDVILLHEYSKIEPQVPGELQVVQIGPVAFAANPAEYFCQFGLNIKDRSRFPYTYVVELANGCIGYVPTADAMGEHGGGYEPRMAMSSKLVPETGQIIEDELVEMLNSLEPGTAHEPPTVEEPGTAWGAGSSSSGDV